MRCSKSCYLYDLELVDLFDNCVFEQVYYNMEIGLVKGRIAQNYGNRFS